MAVLQTYVNDYRLKTKLLGLEKLGYIHEFEYAVTMSDVDWQLFEDVGIILDQKPVPMFDEAEAEIDLTENRLMKHCWRQDQHVAQIYGSMAGVETAVLPKLRQVAVGTDWFVTGMPLGFPYLPEIAGDTLVRAVDGQIGGIIGAAGWETYLACAMGLPVIEIKPVDRSPNLLSKWVHKSYRMVDGGGNVPQQIKRAMLDMELSCSTHQVEIRTD
jgi:hypothetical protein